MHLYHDSHYRRFKCSINVEYVHFEHYLAILPVICLSLLPFAFPSQTRDTSSQSSIWAYRTASSSAVLWFVASSFVRPPESISLTYTGASIGAG